MTNQDSERKCTEDEINAGLHISDAAGQHVLPHLRSVGSKKYWPPCDNCSFYHGKNKCVFYPKQIPKAFLVGDHICGRYIRRGHDAHGNVRPKAKPTEKI